MAEWLICGRSWGGANVSSNNISADKNKHLENFLRECGLTVKTETGVRRDTRRPVTFYRDHGSGGILTKDAAEALVKRSQRRRKHRRDKGPPTNHEDVSLDETPLLIIYIKP